MKLFLFSFILAWLAGVIVSVFDTRSGLLIMGSFLVFALMCRWRSSLPYMTALLILFVFGWLVGSSSGVQAQVCVPQSPFIARVTQVRRVEIRRTQYVIKADVGCTLLMYTHRFPEYRVGDILEIIGEVQQLADMPQQYLDYAAYLERRGISATIRYPDTITVRGVSPLALDSARARIRARIGKVFSEPEASLVMAMTLADRGTVPQEIQEQFRRTGTSHILAISGLHVSLVASMIVGVFILLPIHPWVRTVMILMVLWMYVVLIGAPVSAVRASIFWTIALVAFRFRMLVSMPTVLIFAAVGMISFNPHILKEVSFQLSFAAVAGIGLMLFITRSIPRADDVRPFSLVVLSSVGAYLGTLPIVVWHFGSVPFYGVIANVIVVPIIPFVLGISILSILISFFSQPVALIGSYVVHILWLWMDRVTRIVADLPGAFVDGASIPLWGIGLYYVALAAIASSILHMQHRTWREVWQ